MDHIQREIVERLRSEGLCVLPFTKLFSEELWQELAKRHAELERYAVT